MPWFRLGGKKPPLEKKVIDLFINQNRTDKISFKSSEKFKSGKEGNYNFEANNIEEAYMYLMGISVKKAREEARDKLTITTGAPRIVKTQKEYFPEITQDYSQAIGFRIVSISGLPQDKIYQLIRMCLEHMADHGTNHGLPVDLTMLTQRLSQNPMYQQKYRGLLNNPRYAQFLGK